MKQYEYLETLVRGLMAFPSDECSLWPFRMSDGYGSQISCQGKMQSVHRLALALKLGRPVDRRLDASHSCGKRGCVNPWHLSEKSRKDNVADRLMHGTSNRHIGKRANAESGYKGVSFHKLKRKWRAQIQIDGKQSHIGYYLNAEDGARAYDREARRLWGTDCFLNFSD